MSANILLIDNNPGDVRLMREAFEETATRAHLHAVDNGVSAMSFLKQVEDYRQAPRPDLIILDLNMPYKDGRAVLAEIKADPGLKCIPVIVLTTSEAEEDILHVYNLNANCYIVKPLDYDRLFEVVRAVQDFWLTIARLPQMCI